MKPDANGRGSPTPASPLARAGLHRVRRAGEDARSSTGGSEPGQQWARLVDARTLLPLASGLPAVRWAFAVMVGLTAAAALVFAGLTPASTSGPVAVGVSMSVYPLAAGLVLARAVVCREERATWLLLGLGLLLYALGFATYHLVVKRIEPPPYPSISDGFWLAFYPVAYVAIVLLARRGIRQLPAGVWLDALVGWLALAALSAVLIIQPGLDAGGELRTVVTNIGYPIGNVLMAGFVLALFVTRGRGSGRGPLLLAGAFLLGVGLDATYLMQTVAGSYAFGTLLDAGWPLMVALVAAAAWQPPVPSQRPAVGERSFVVLPAVAVTIAVAVLIYGNFSDVGVAAPALATGTLLTAAMRMFLTHRTVQRLRVLAATDPLTGLLNHREFHTALEHAMHEAQQTAGRLAVLMLDLDRFKQINDRLGHAEGDRLLRSLSRLLAQACRAGDLVCRVGGDEFGIVLPGADRATAAAIGERIRRAVDDHPADVGISYGAAEWPTDGLAKETLLAAADSAVYAAKAAAPERSLLVGDRSS